MARDFDFFSFLWNPRHLVYTSSDNRTGVGYVSSATMDLPTNGYVDGNGDALVDASGNWLVEFITVNAALLDVSGRWLVDVVPANDILVRYD
jgi:hypothetical protein